MIEKEGKPPERIVYASRNPTSPSRSRRHLNGSKQHPPCSSLATESARASLTSLMQSYYTMFGQFFFSVFFMQLVALVISFGSVILSTSGRFFFLSTLGHLSFDFESGRAERKVCQRSESGKDAQSDVVVAQEHFWDVLISRQGRSHAEISS